MKTKSLFDRIDALPGISEMGKDVSKNMVLHWRTVRATADNPKVNTIGELRDALMQNIGCAPAIVNCYIPKTAEEWVERMEKYYRIGV